jgi:hypothetical protein
VTRPGALLALLVAGPATLPAQDRAAARERDDRPEGAYLEAELRLVSRYVWRGYDLSRGRPALQPYVEGSLPWGLGANLFATGALDRQTQVDELQAGLMLAREVSPGWEVSVGYLAYLMPGTETEPSSDEADPLAFSSSGEFFAALERQGAVQLTLTYSRGHGVGEGNSVNLAARRELAWSDGRWSAEPYAQVDYLDEYGAPAGLAERLSGIELGLPMRRALGPARFEAVMSLVWVPSSYVRDANAAAGGTGRSATLVGAVAIVVGGN